MPYILVHNSNEVLNFFDFSDGQFQSIFSTFTGSRKNCWEYIDNNNLIINSGIGFPERPPEIVVPQEVTRRQLFRSFILFDTGLKRSVLKSSLNTEELLIDFEESTTFKRDDLLISGLRSSFSITNKQMDQIFINASGI